MSCDFLRRNQISKRSPLSPTFSVIPISAVYIKNRKCNYKQCIVETCPPQKSSNLQINSYFEGLFINVNVISSFDLFGLAEEDEVFKQEDVPEVFPPSTPDYELILAAELTLLF